MTDLLELAVFYLFQKSTLRGSDTVTIVCIGVEEITTVLILTQQLKAFAELFINNF